MKRLLIFFLTSAFFLAACGVAPQSKPAPEYAAPPSQPEVVLEAPAQPPAGETRSFGDTSGGGAEAATVERKVIQEANLSIVVADPQAKMTAIQKMAEAMGGFVVSSSLRQTYTSANLQVPEGDITIRVPQEKLDKALETIKADAVEVQNENRSGKDVTADYVDLQSRLKTHEQAAEQLSKILEQKTESAEVIEVFNQLVYHREQIELIKGQMKYIEEAAALSAISVHIVAEETLQPLEIGGWKPAGEARDALQALINFLQGFASFLIWLVILIIPAGLLILVLLWAIWKVFRLVWRKLFPRKKGEPVVEDSAQKPA
ncbi:MAG: DUF4349 domain-containing protein [Anaerolineales bacterium]